MTVQRWDLVATDEEPVVRVRVTLNSLAVDLSDVTTTVLEYRQDGGAWATLSGGGSVEQGDVSDVDSEGTRYWYARYDWGVGDTDALSGIYEHRFLLTRSGGNTLHVPSLPPWHVLYVWT